jgi:hypothetical protein
MGTMVILLAHLTVLNEKTDEIALRTKTFRWMANWCE